MSIIKNIWYGGHFKNWSTWDKFKWILIILKDSFPLSKYSRTLRSIKKLEEKIWDERVRK